MRETDVACCCVDDVLVYAILEVFLDVLMSDVFPVIFSRDCSVFLDDFSIVFIVVNNSERKLGYCTTVSTSQAYCLP